MRIVLTGVTGQVGRALIHPLGRIGHVIPADRSVLNLAEPASLSDALDRLAPDLIINSAAYTAVDRAEDERELAFTINGEAAGILARVAARKRVPLLHFSTDYVFDGEGETPWHEDSQTAPLSVYGESKVAGEQLICAAGGAHLIVRTSWVYAAQGTNFLRTIARVAHERTELRVVADQIGAPTSARIIADAVARLLEADINDLPRGFARAKGVVNIAASGETSWHGFATRIVDGLQARGHRLSVQSIMPLRSDEYPTKARRPRNSRLDLARLRKVFGISMPRWDEALETELNEISSSVNVDVHPSS
jgi:dTDP-4-dehydrorhamnose reductase